MAPDKFEKYIREKMQEREITPSADAWEKIAGQLPAGQEKWKKPIIWYSIAASFVGILIIGLYVIQSPKPELESPVQVVATEEKEADKNPEVKKELPVTRIPEAQQTEALAETPATLQPDDYDKGQERPLKTIPVSTKQDLASAEISVPVEKENISPGEIKKKEELIIEAKITEVVAEVRLLEMNSEALTEAEVDSLLRKAQGELLKEKIFNSDRTVDAMALLNEVEDELDRSLRDQIFDRLKSGFNKVRTAVADRNN